MACNEEYVAAHGPHIERRLSDALSRTISEQAPDPIARIAELIRQPPSDGAASPQAAPAWVAEVVATARSASGGTGIADGEAGTGRLPADGPWGYRVSGAGTPEANGFYRREGEYKGMALFAKGRLWLLRYALRSGDTWWYIADSEQLESDDGDLYRVRCSDNLPPMHGWAKAKDGRLPAPRLTRIQNDPRSHGSDWSLAVWLRSLSLERVLASAVLQPLEAHLNAPPSAAAQLAFSRALGSVAGKTPGAMRQLLAATPLLDRLAEAMCAGFEELNAAPAATAAELHTKFVTESDAFTLSYSGLSTFFGGLDGLIGPPSAAMGEALLVEHTRSADSHTAFTATNYQTVTTSEVEYWFVCDPSPQRLRDTGRAAWPGEGTRASLPLARFEAPRRAVNARLSASKEPPVLVVELTAGRLCTPRAQRTVRCRRDSLANALRCRRAPRLTW